MARNLGDNINEVCNPLYDKISYASHQLESKSRTIINIDTYEATVLSWALEKYMRDRNILGGRVMTNADCIRNMSDEQLYEFLSEWECGDIDYSVTFCDLCNEATKRGEVGNVLNLDCDGCRKHWLQRDAVDYGGLMYWKRNTTFDIADRKTEPNSSEIPNNCEGLQDWKDRMWAEAIVTESQTERSE